MKFIETPDYVKEITCVHLFRSQISLEKESKNQPPSWSYLFVAEQLQADPNGCYLAIYDMRDAENPILKTKSKDKKDELPYNVFHGM